MPFSPFNRWGLPSPFNRWGPGGGAVGLSPYTFDGQEPTDGLVLDFDRDFFWANGAATTEAVLLKTGDRTGFTIDGADMVGDAGKAYTMTAYGVMDIVGTSNPEVRFLHRIAAGNQRIYINNGGGSGIITGFQTNDSSLQSYTFKSGVIAGTAATNVPFMFSITFNDSGARGAWDGAAGFTNSDKVSAFPTFTGQDVLFGDVGTLNFSAVVIHNADIGNAGRLAGSTGNF